MPSWLRTFCRLFLFSLLTCLTSTVALAADWPPIDPADLAMRSLPEQPGAPAVILRREETADALNHVHSVYMRIKVLNEAGKRYADVVLPYGLSIFTITDVSGRTIHADGSIIPFQGTVFDKESLKENSGENRRHIKLKSFTLPDVQIGTIIDFRYSLRYVDSRINTRDERGQSFVFYAPEWDVQSDLFQRSAYFKFIPYPGLLMLPHDRIGRGVAWTTTLPNGVKPIHHDVPQNGIATERAMSEYIDLQINNVPPFVREPFMLPEKAIRYRVDFFYMVSSNQEDFWKEEGKFWSKDVEHFLGLRDGVAQSVAQAVGANDTAEQKVRKIYGFVSALENQSYNPPRQEKEEKVLGIKADEGAEDVLRQRSGNHDQLNLLFAAMVRTAGLPAWIMRVPSREERIFEPELLTTRQFDAEIVIVELGGKDVFLDPGSKFCPYGLIDWRYSNDRGLRQRADGKTEISESPLPDYTQAMMQRLARLQLTDEGKVEGTIKAGFYGIEAMERRQQGGKTDAEGRKKLLEDEVKGWLPADSEVHLVGMPNWEATEQNLVAEFKIVSPLATGSGKRWIVPVHIFQINDKARFPESARINSVYFDYPWRQLDDVHITLPASMTMESLPPSESVRQDYAIYKVDQKQEGEHGIAARRDLTVAGIAFPVTMYQDVKGFFDKVRAGDDQQAILKAGAHAEPK
jgi:hypothetical protein